MKSDIRILISECTDPFFNSAFEDYIFRNLRPQERILLIWRNTPSVFIGRFQNIFQECNVMEIEKDGLPLLRRQSGGGTVFHDLGNTNFTFFCSREDYNENENFTLVIDALHTEFQLSVERSGRNDLLLESRKISGSAFKFTGKSAMHHGTLLINADLRKLKKYLSPPDFEFRSKGIQSVSSSVLNISELSADATHESVYRAIISRFIEKYGKPEGIETYSKEIMKAVADIVQRKDDFSSWEWIYGKNPKFTFYWDGLIFYVEKGYIRAVKKEEKEQNNAYLDKPFSLYDFLDDK